MQVGVKWEERFILESRNALVCKSVWMNGHCDARRLTDIMKLFLTQVWAWMLLFQEDKGGNSNSVTNSTKPNVPLLLLATLAVLAKKITVHVPPPFDPFEFQQTDHYCLLSTSPSFLFSFFFFWSEHEHRCKEVERNTRWRPQRKQMETNEAAEVCTSALVTPHYKDRGGRSAVNMLAPYSEDLWGREREKERERGLVCTRHFLHHKNQDL